MTDTAPKSHIALVVICITILASMSAAGGMWLTWKGFQGGTELIVTLNTGISGLIGFLGGRGSSGIQDKVKISNSPDNPVPVTAAEPT